MADDPPETNEPGPGPGKDTVGVPMIVGLAFYLVVITTLLLWGIYRRWPTCHVICVDQAATSASPSSTPTPTPTATPTPTPEPTSPPTSPPTQPTTTPTPIEIESVSPKTGPMDCNIQVTIKGKGFKPGASVLFGGMPATNLPVDPSALPVDPSGQSITVRPPAHAEGDVDLVVRNPDGASSNIAKAAYTYTCPPTSETDLFLLVVFAGAVGGALHGMRSLYWYTGLRNLLKSWTLMYVLLPFTGATMAVVFYAIIRAGLLPVQTTKSISLVVIAIALLVGLFSPQAAIKLKDIANAFLAKPEPGPPGESKPQDSAPPGGSRETKPGASKPVITPDTGRAGNEVKITGTGMKTVSSITFGGVEGTNKAIAADGTITVTTPLESPPRVGPVEVVVTGDKRTVRLSFTYT